MKPKLIMLIGPPLSGKDTYININDFNNYNIISRDDILMSLSYSKDYSSAFKEVDSKNVDDILKKKITDSVQNKQNVLLNMTNLTKKGRKKNLSKFANYEKTAIVFPRLDMVVYGDRNNRRKIEENKSIPLSVMLSMLSSWEEVSLDEGFDKIIKL